MLRQESTMWWTTAVLLISVSAMFLIGCESKSILEDTPSDTEVAVTASPESVANGSNSVVEVTVVANSVGLPDQVITFSVEPPDGGYCTPSVDTTDANGEAATVFTATDTGSVTVRASISGTSFSGSADVTVSESSQTGSGNISVTVSPILLLANGGDTSLVTVTVLDAQGQPAPDSTIVYLAAGEKFEDIDGNGYFTAGVDTIIYDAIPNGAWDAVGVIPSTAYVSGGAGEVQVQYIAGNEAATVYIRATVLESGYDGYAETALQLTPDATIASIVLGSDSISLAVKRTGGLETAMLYATGYDANGNTVPEGLQISFIITDGPDTTDDGEHFASLTGADRRGPYVAVTNSSGIASCPISSGTVAGTIRIRAYADTVLSNATQVMVSAGPPAYIVVGSEQCNVPYWDDVGIEVGIVAVVSDVYMNPVNDSTVVYFTTDEGTMKSHEDRTRNNEGMATSKWICGNNVPDADGRVYIYAETAGGTVADTSMFFNSHYPDTLIVSGVPVSLPADGKSKATVVVTGIDLNGNPVMGGTKFAADANFLKVAGSILQDGCYSSSARVKITSATLDVDYSTPGGNDDGIGAYDVVIYYHGATAASVFTVALTTGNAYSGNSSITAQGSAVVNETVNISATIKDRFNNPLGDHTLNMTASSGTVNGATQETNSYGEAAGFIWTAPAAATTATISITDTDPRGGIVLTATIDVTDE